MLSQHMVVFRYHSFMLLFMTTFSICAVHICLPYLFLKSFSGLDRTNVFYPLFLSNNAQLKIKQISEALLSFLLKTSGCACAFVSLNVKDRTNDVSCKPHKEPNSAFLHQFVSSLEQSNKLLQRRFYQKQPYLLGSL